MYSSVLKCYYSDFSDLSRSMTLLQKVIKHNGGIVDTELLNVRVCGTSI